MVATDYKIRHTSSGISLSSLTRAFHQVGQPRDDIRERYDERQNYPHAGDKRKYPDVHVHDSTPIRDGGTLGGR